MPDRCVRIEAERFRKLEELDQIDAALRRLDACHIGLRTLKQSRELVLRQAGFLALLHEEIPQRLMARRGEGAWHSALVVGRVPEYLRCALSRKSTRVRPMRKLPQPRFEPLSEQERADLPFTHAHMALGGMTAAWHFLRRIDEDDRAEAVALLEHALESVERLKRRLRPGKVVLLAARKSPQ
jgi:hypothetical protein